MTASQVMLLAVTLLIVAHWANGQPAVNGKMIIEVGAAILIVAMLDHGRTEGIAQGLAWLFFVAVILSSNSPLNILKKFGGTSTPAAAPKTQIA